MKQILTIICGLLLILGVKLADYTGSYSSYTEPASTDAIKSGSPKSKVQWVQAALNFCIQVGVIDAEPLDVDGSYGPATIAVVKAYQTKYSLEVDGVFGPQSIKTMISILPDPTHIISTQYEDYMEPASTDAIKSGSPKTKVQWVQAALNFLIMQGSIDAEFLYVDGSYGPATTAAVKAYQTKYSLEVDGKFGPKSIANMKKILGIDEGKQITTDNKKKILKILKYG